MTRNHFPDQFDRRATEYLRQEIAEEISKDEEHDGPREVSESITHAEETEVEEKNGKFVTK